ncbi:MAG: terminase family protein [Caulobacteraceae bacterium]
MRRTRPALEPAVQRARAIFAPEGATWSPTGARFTWPSGATLAFRHLDRDADADGYQGHAYSRVYVEELTQFADPRAVDKLKATLRSAEGAAVGFRATCNPGGPGHAWVKARYIDAGAGRIMREAYLSPFDGARRSLSRLFIPARLTDNPALLANDPDYVARLAQTGSAALVKAWLEGDWNIVEGAFFDAWSVRNVVRPFAVPPDWTRFRAFDWGFAAPFSVGWWCVASDEIPVEGGRIVPRGALVRYREWYGAGGLRLTAEEVAAGILSRESGDRIAYGVADPSIFREDGGPSIGERMRRAGVSFRPADNTRVGKAGAQSGWDQMRARIGGHDGAPMLYVFDTCRDFIRTVPVLQHDPARPEDLDTAAEDHAADEARYACSSRPMAARAVAPDPWRDRWDARRPVNGWKTA